MQVAWVSRGTEGRALMCLVSGGVPLGSVSDHTEKAGTLQEKETQRLLGGLGKSELVQAAFCKGEVHQLQQGFCPYLTQVGDDDQFTYM